MSKQESLILKGVAICLMIFLHLFNHQEPMMQPNLFVGDKPLVQWLAAAANPVSIYLILSGYGMYFIYKQGIGDKHRWSRIINVYLHHWVILSVFAVIGFVRFGGAIH